MEAHLRRHVRASLATALRSKRNDLLRRLHLRHGRPNRQHRAHLLRHPIRHLHHRHGRHILLYRRHGPKTPAHLRCRRHGHLHVRSGQRAGLVRNAATERSPGQSQRQSASYRPSSQHRHRLLLPTRTHLFHHVSAHRVGLRGGSVVIRDARHGHGSRLDSKLAFQLRHRLLHPARLQKHLLEALHHLRRFMFRRRGAGLSHVPGDGGEDN